MAGYTISNANHRYLDPTSGTDGAGYGLSMTSGYRTFGYAVANTPAGGALWIRRGTDETVGASITLTAPDGNPASPTIISSWPRASTVVSGVLFGTNSDTILCSGAFSEYAHITRTFSISGNNYIIGRVDDANTAYIDPPFLGNSGLYDITLDADKLYYLSSGYGTAQGATLKSTWDSDSSNIYRLGFNGAYELFFNQVISMDKYNIAVTGTVGSSYLVREYYTRDSNWYNTYFKCVADDAYLIMTYCTKNNFKNCVFRGMPAYDADQNALYVWGNTKIQDSVCDSIGRNFILAYGGGSLTLDNVKAPLKGHCYIGVDDMFNGTTEHNIYNCSFSGCASAEFYSTSVMVGRYNIVNYNRIAGDNRQFLPTTGWIYQDTSTFSPITTLKCSWDKSVGGAGFRSVEGVKSEWEHGKMVLEQKVWLDSADGPWTIKYNVYNGFSSSGTSDQCWLECSESAVAFDFGYGSQLTKSIESVPSSGWAYVSCTGITGGYVTTKLFYSRYSTTSSYWIDPQPIITRG